MNPTVLRVAGEPVAGPAVQAAIAQAAEVLRAGDAVVLPTDTVYGVAALASTPAGPARLVALKGRAATRPFAVLVADAAQGLGLVAPGGVTAPVRRVAARHWPGALTLVLPRAPALAELALGGDAATIGVRCPASPLVRALAAQVGPLATTSANRSGAPTPVDAGAAAAVLLGDVALVLDGGRLTGSASTVVDATADPWRLLREGPLRFDEVLAAAG